MTYQQFRPSKFKVLPDVVKNLLIINGIFYLATIVLDNTLGIDLIEKLGLYYIHSEYFRPYQFITHLFMHSNITIWHILSNMFALWMFGSMLENVWGPKRFLTFYLVTGLGAALIHSSIVYYEVSTMEKDAQQMIEAKTPDAFFEFVKEHVPLEVYPAAHRAEVLSLIDHWSSDPFNSSLRNEAHRYAAMIVDRKSNIPTVGASGAVFGLLLAFGMMFPNTVIYLYFAIPIKAKYFVILYGLLELYLGFRNNPADNVAHFAHLGGMLFGFLLIKYWNRQSRNHLY